MDHAGLPGFVRAQSPAPSMMPHPHDASRDRPLAAHFRVNILPLRAAA
jgi:hypothetical protein